MGRFQVSDIESESASPFGEEEEAYRYGDNTSEGTENSKRSINNNDIPSDDSSSSSEKSSSYGSSTW